MFSLVQDNVIYMTDLNVGSKVWDNYFVEKLPAHCGKC